MLVVFAGAGGFCALLAEDAELFYGGVRKGRAREYAGFRGEKVPLERTACHSSSDFWTGYDIFSLLAVLVLKRAERNGIVGIDLKAVTRPRGWRARYWKGERRDG